MKLNVKYLVLLLLGLSFLFLLFGPQIFKTPLKEISYGDFLAELGQPGKVASVSISENQNKDSGTIVEVKLADGTAFKANFPLYLHPDLSEKLEQSGVAVIILPVPFNWFNLLWIVLPVGIIILILYQRSGGHQFNEAKSFTSKRGKLAEGQIKERFSDVAGIDEVKEELSDIVDFLRFPQKYLNLGARIPRGVLLCGAPGTGKTLLARAIAGEAGVPFFSASASEFVEMFVGVGAARVRDLFGRARESVPAIVFIDEIDAVGRRRGAGLGQSHDEREQTLNQIFVEMDGFDERTNIIVLAATNRPDILDPALLRPKRFDRKVIVGKPDVRGREAILAVHTKDKPLAGSVDLKKIARSLPGATGADLENIVNEAAIIAAKRGETEISHSCFLQAVDKILLGKEKKIVMDAKEKELAAYHESGHAFVSKSLPGADPVRKISIIARGESLGQTLSLPENDRYILSEQYLLNMVAICLGGRLAEEIFLQTRSTGAKDDLEKATEIAQKMVCSYGMSKLGPRAFGSKEEEIFLGREVARKEGVSPEILKKIDDEVTRIIQGAYEDGRRILSENKKRVEALAKALLEKETLEQEEIDAICRGEK